MASFSAKLQKMMGYTVYPVWGALDTITVHYGMH